MSQETESPNSPPAAENDLASQVQGRRSSMAGELIAMMRENKKWWLLPVILAVTAIGVFIILGSTAAAPFIYALF